MSQHEETGNEAERRARAAHSGMQAAFAIGVVLAAVSTALLFLITV